MSDERANGNADGPSDDDAVRTLLEALPVPAFALDDDGHFAAVNAPFSTLTGEDAETLVGDTPARLLAEADVAGFTEAISAADAGPVSRTVSLQRADGTVAPALLSLVTVAGTAVGIVTDRRYDRRREHQLIGLLRATRGLIQAADASHAISTAVWAAHDALGLDTVVGYHHRTGRLVPVTATTETDWSPTAVGPGHELWDCWEASASRTVGGDRLGWEPGTTAVVVPLANHGLLVAELGPEDDRLLVELLGITTRAALDGIVTRGELADQRDRFQRLFDSVGEPTVEVSFDAEGYPRILAVNEAFEETFGYSEDEAVGRTIDDLIVPESRRDEGRRINAAVREDQRYTAEVRRETVDGVRDFLLRTAIPEGADVGYGIYTDITEQKERERRIAALHESTREMFAADDLEAVAEQMIATATEVLGQPLATVFLYDEEQGRLVQTTATESFYELFGELPAFGPGDAIVWDAFEKGEVIILEEASADPRAHQPKTPVGGYLAHPLGEFGVLGIGSPEVGAPDDDDVALARLLATNATAALERIDRERALRERETELERQNERLEQFASLVSHDLRNPLAVAQGYTQVVAESGDLSELDRVQNAHERIAELIDDILTMTREGATVEETDPVSLEWAATEAWKYVATDDATLDVLGDGTLEAHPSRLRRLLENLFRNAVEHVADDVTVRVGRTGDGDGFFVEDDGPGIPEEDRERVFEPGHTSQADGTGFGLTIVRQIAEAHGWTVEVREAAGGGACFVVSGVTWTDAD